MAKPLYDGIMWASSAWHGVQASKIRNCFWKHGFPATATEMPDTRQDDDCSKLDELITWFNGRENLPTIIIAEDLSAENHLAVSAGNTDDIVASVLNANHCNSDDEEEDEVNNTTIKPPSKVDV